MFYKTETIALVIDAPSMNTAAKNINLLIDWKKFRSEFARRGRLLRASYIAYVIDSEDHNPMIKQIDWMSYNGFNAIVKKAHVVDHDQVKKFNINVEFTLEAMQLAIAVDHIVLFTGDSAYEPLIEKIQHMGVRVSVCGVTDITANCLRKQADSFMDITAISDLIAMEGAKHD